MIASRVACLFVLAVSGVPPESPTLERFSFQRIEMAVPVRVVLYAPDETTAQKAADAAFERIRQLNDVLSDYDPESELRQLCSKSKPGVSVPVSDDLWRVLVESQLLAKRSDGAFDVTIGPVVRLWRRARRRTALPPKERLEEARRLVGFRLVRLDSDRQCVELLEEDMRLDLGGIAKGYIIDQALAELRRHGITRALVDAGGDVGLADRPPEKSGWVIGVAALEVGAEPSMYLSLSNCAIATSGDSWQFVEIDGVRYSHIIDPRTGIGLTDHSSVTVVAENAMTADGLASAVSVLGPKKGLVLIDATANTAAYVVRAPKGKVETSASRRWQDLPEWIPVP